MMHSRDSSQIVAARDVLPRRRTPVARASAPRTSRAIDDGSGTPTSENEALKVGVTPLIGPTTSVPILDQSGSSASFRIHDWRSVEPGGNGVPDPAIGLGAESQ